MAKYLSQTADYVVLDPEGQSLPTIAGDWTIDAGYALAIANFNGLDAMQADADYSFPTGEVIAIPMNWLKPEIAGAVQMAPGGAQAGPLRVDIAGAGGKPGAASWLLWGALALVAVGLLS